MSTYIEHHILQYSVCSFKFCSAICLFFRVIWNDSSPWCWSMLFVSTTMSQSLPFFAGCSGKTTFPKPNVAPKNHGLEEEFPFNYGGGWCPCQLSVVYLFHAGYPLFLLNPPLAGWLWRLAYNTKRSKISHILQSWSIYHLNQYPSPKLTGKAVEK